MKFDEINHSYFLKFRNKQILKKQIDRKFKLIHTLSNLCGMIIASVRYG